MFTLTSNPWCLACLTAGEPRLLWPTVAQVNLGEAVLRGLFSRWIEQPFRLNGSGLSQSRRGLGRNGSYSSGESGEDEDSDDQDHTSTYSSRSGTLRSRTSSEASAGDRGNGGGSGNGGDGGARSKRSGGTDHFPGREGLDLDLMNSGSGGGLGGGRGIGDDTVLWVTETDLGGNGGIQRTLLQKRVGEFDGREVRRCFVGSPFALFFFPGCE